jgi:hypothetical protein
MAKIKEGIFVSLQTGEVMTDRAVDETLSEVKLRIFKVVTTNFLGNFKAENYKSLAEELFSAYKVMSSIFIFWTHILTSSLQTWVLLAMSIGNTFIRKYP